MLQPEEEEEGEPLVCVYCVCVGVSVCACTVCVCVKCACYMCLHLLVCLCIAVYTLASSRERQEEEKRWKRKKMERGQNSADHHARLICCCHYSFPSSHSPFNLHTSSCFSVWSRPGGRRIYRKTKVENRDDAGVERRVRGGKR